MKPFKSFFIEGVYQLTDSEINKVKELVDRYIAYFGEDKLTGFLGRRKDPKKLYKNELNERGEFFLGRIEYTDLKTNEIKPLYVDVSLDPVRARADYDEQENKITLYYSTLEDNKELIRSTLVHELLHAKQQYKKKGKEYTYAVRSRVLPGGIQSLRSKRGYFLHPTEFPVHVTTIVNGLEHAYNEYSSRIDNAKDEGKESEIKFWSRKRDNLLTFIGNFLKSGGKISEDISYPKFIDDQRDFINTLFKNRNNPKYKDKYQSFLKSLTKIYNQIKEYENR